MIIKDGDTIKIGFEDFICKGFNKDEITFIGATLNKGKTRLFHNEVLVGPDRNNDTYVFSKRDWQDYAKFCNKDISKILLKGEPGYFNQPYASMDAEVCLKMFKLGNEEKKMTTFEKYKDLFAGEVNPNIKKVFSILCDEIDSLKDRVNECIQSMEEGSELVPEPPNIRKLGKEIHESYSEAAKFLEPAAKCNLGDCRIFAPDTEFRKELPPDDLIIAHEKNGGRWERREPANSFIMLRVKNNILGLTWESNYWYEVVDMREIWKDNYLRPVNLEGEPVSWNSLVEVKKVESRIGLPDPEVVDYVYRIGGYWYMANNQGIQWYLKCEDDNYFVKTEYIDNPERNDNMWTRLGSKEEAVGWTSVEIQPMKDDKPFPWPDFSFKDFPSEDEVSAQETFGSGIWEYQKNEGTAYCFMRHTDNIEVSFSTDNSLDKKRLWKWFSPNENWKALKMRPVDVEGKPVHILVVS